MLSRSAVALARSHRARSFAFFFGKVAPSLTNTQWPKRMGIAGALWSLTMPKHKGSPTSKDINDALALYKRYGNTVLAKVRAEKREKLAIKGKKKKGGRIRKVHTPHKEKQLPKNLVKIRKGNPKRASKSLKISKPRGPASGKNLNTAKRVRSVPLRKKQTSRTSKYANQGSVYRKSKREPSSATVPYPSNKKHSSAATISINDHTGAKRARYEAFRASLLKQANLKPSASLNRQIHRLWVLISTQTHLSPKAREYMALRLIKKSHQGSKNWVQGKKASRVSVKPKATPKSMLSSQKKKPKVSERPKKHPSSSRSNNKTLQARKKNRSPYIKFYRAMVLTGRIPNHPKGVRSRMIKELWHLTTHVKTLNSKIKLGTAYATGAQEIPKSSQTTTPSATAQTLKKPVHVIKPAKVQVKKTSKMLSLKAPSNFEADPFLASYRVLMKYVPNKTANARMRAISRAWMRTDVRDGNDTRTPEQRIQALAQELDLL